MKDNFELLLPMMPLYIERREIGSKKLTWPSISVSDLTRSEAEEYAELMKQTFMKHWEEKVSRKEK